MNTPLLIITAYLAVLLLLGAGASRLFRGTSLDYLLASHSIGPFLLLMSLFGTTMTAFSLVGSTGEAYREGMGIYGLMASSSAILHPFCFYFIGLKVWQFGRRYGYSTQIQFFEDRLQSRHFGLLLFPVSVGLIVPYILIGIMGGGGTLQAVGIDRWLGSLIICGVVLCYVFMGGMRGTAWANAFQTTVFMVLGVLTFVVLVKGMGGQESFIGSLKAASEAVAPEKLSRTNMPRQSYLAFLLIPFSLGTFPHIFQHWLTARNSRAFKLPIVAHPLFVMIVWAPCVLIGMWASAPGVKLPEGIRSSAILAHLVTTHSGDALSGLLTAGILAAIMSSLDSQFLCLGTMFTRDVLPRFRNTTIGDGAPDDDRRTVLVARLFVCAVVGVSYLLSLVAPSGIFHLGVWCFAGFTALCPLILAALYWRGLSAAGAWASVLTATILWLYMFWQSGWAADDHYAFYGLHPVIVLTIASTVSLVGISLITSKPDSETLARYFR